MFYKERYWLLSFLKCKEPKEKKKTMEQQQSIMKLSSPLNTVPAWLNHREQNLRENHLKKENGNFWIIKLIKILWVWMMFGCVFRWEFFPWRTTVQSKPSWTKSATFLDVITQPQETLGRIERQEETSPRMGDRLEESHSQPTFSPAALFKSSHKR